MQLILESELIIGKNHLKRLFATLVALIGGVLSFPTFGSEASEDHQELFVEPSVIVPYLRLPTLNRMGDDLVYVDQYTQAFIEYAAQQTSPALEVGSGYGFITRMALKQGAEIYANDLDERHLMVLKLNTPPDCLHRLTLVPGHFPDHLHFENETFSAILAARVFNYIDDRQLATAARYMFNWLKKGGKIFITADTPYMNAWKEFIPIYEKRKQNGVEGPGVLADPAQFAPTRVGNLPEVINFLDPDTLKHIFEEAGFIIEEATFFDRPHYPSALQYDGRESVGLIARKPE